MDAYEKDLLAVVLSRGEDYAIVRMTGPEYEDLARQTRIEILKARGYERCAIFGWCDGKMDADYRTDSPHLRAIRYALFTFAFAMAGRVAPPMFCQGHAAAELEALYALPDTRTVL